MTCIMRKVCRVLYTELFYAIIPACYYTFCCSVIPTYLHTFLMFFTLVNLIFIAAYLIAFTHFVGSCTAQCKMLLFCANTVVRESAKFEGGGGGGGGLATFWRVTFATVIHDTGNLLGQENTNRFWRFGEFLARYFRDGYSRHWDCLLGQENNNSELS